MLSEIDQEWKGQCSGMLLISGIQESRSEAEPGMMVARGWGSGKEEGLVRGNQLSVTQDSEFWRPALRHSATRPKSPPAVRTDLVFSILNSYEGRS